MGATRAVLLAERLRLMQELTLGVGTARSLADAMRAALRAITTATGWEYGEGWLKTTSWCNGQPRGVVSMAACWPRAGPRFAELRAAAERVEADPRTGLPFRFGATGRAKWLANPFQVSNKDLARRHEAERAGVKAVALIPIFHHDNEAAMLMLFVCRTGPDDRNLMSLIGNAMAPLGHLVRHRLAEEKLAQHRDQLERMVEERTGQLERSRAQLLVSDRMAALGTMAAGLGHDMNNVLLPVRAHLNALKSRECVALEGAPELRHYRAIERSIAYLQQLADGLHFLALDPERDDSVGDERGTDLHQWWSQVGALLAKAVPRHVVVRTSLPSALPRARVASHRLTQAMLNLVVNAGEAIPAEGRDVPGVVRVWAEAATRPASGHVVRLAVTDNGVGMSEEVQRRSLEMFYSTKVRKSGAGLGLAMVKRLVDRANGGLEISSEEGRGTTVTLVLPAARKGVQRGASAGPVASVCIQDGRSAALVRQLLQASGARPVEPGAPTPVEIQVVEPGQMRLTELRAWRRQQPQGSIVSFGRPAARALQAWMALAPIVVEDPSSLEDVRAALRRAVARQP